MQSLDGLKKWKPIKNPRREKSPVGFVNQNADQKIRPKPAWVLGFEVHEAMLII